MKLKLFLLTTLVFLSGCASLTAPIYETKNLNPVLSSSMREHQEIGVVRFDSIVSDQLNDSGGSGGAFGVIGVLLEHAADDSPETFAIDLQNESMKIIKEKFSALNPNYINTDQMNKYSVSELTKRFKSNRLWGMRSIKNEKIARFFTENPTAKFALHVQSYASEYSKTLMTDTSWLIYDEALNKVGDINTRSVEKLASEYLTNKEKFEKLLILQQKNVDEFLKIIW